MTATFRRAADFDRRTDMIEATLDCIADNGIQAASVRAVAARAGVSNGLIRHHFASKGNLISAAYRRSIEMFMEPFHAILDRADLTAPERLAHFVAVTLGPAATDPRRLSLWASFVSQVHLDPDLAHEHREGYHATRATLAGMIEEIRRQAGRPVGAEECRRLAIAVNAILDGLWVEGCLSPDEIDEATRIEIGLQSIEAVLGLRLPRLPAAGPPGVRPPGAKPASRDPATQDPATHDPAPDEKA